MKDGLKKEGWNRRPNCLGVDEEMAERTGREKGEEQGG